MGGGRDDRVSGAERFPGEDSWVPDRVGGDRGAAVRARSSAGSGGGGAGRRGRGEATGGLLHGCGAGGRGVRRRRRSRRVAGVSGAEFGGGNGAGGVVGSGEG